MPRSQGSVTLQVGDAAPEFDLPAAVGGGRVRLGDYRDGRLLLVFLRHRW